MRNIIVCQGLGILCLVALIWTDEYFDLANKIFSRPKMPFNIIEAICESGLGILLGISVIWYTQRLIRHIRYLEGFITLCAFCKKVRVDDAWISLESFISQHGEPILSHGFCPECTRKHYGEYVSISAAPNSRDQ